jgi:pimeloyl-ACP methyl ester carboxylesterase
MKTNPNHPRMVLILLALSLFLSSCSFAGSPEISYDKTRFREAFTPTSTPPSPPYFLPGECRFPVPPGEVHCGDLYLLEDRADPDSRLISLHVAVFPSFSLNPEPDPVIYLIGGGGADTLSAADFLLRTAGTQIRTKRDFILYNQRGVKRNDPYLVCPGEAEFQTALNTFVHGKSGGNQLEYDFMMTCRDHFRDQGINLDRYDSLANAADLVDLITVLGYEQANIYGVSYGTRLGLTIMRHYPDLIRSAILDSILPPQIDFPSDAITSYVGSIENLFSACASQESCSKAYPDLEGDFYSVLEQLQANPVPLIIAEDEILLDHVLFLNVIYIFMHSAPTLPMIPQAIHNTSQGEYSWLEEPIRGVLTYTDLVTTGVQYSSFCRDEVLFDSQENNQALLEGIGDGWQDYFDLTFYYQTCQDWVTEPGDPIENTPVTSGIPTLVLTGHFDPITAPAWNLDTANYLENSFYYEFPNLAHGVLRSDSCALAMGLAFLDDPWSVPDASCMEQLSFPDFR